MASKLEKRLSEANEIGKRHFLALKDPRIFIERKNCRVEYGMTDSISGDGAQEGHYLAHYVQPQIVKGLVIKRRG